MQCKEPACQCRSYRRCGFDSWVRKIPWRRIWQPTSVFCLGNPMDREAWQATVYGVAKESDMTELLTLEKVIYRERLSNYGERKKMTGREVKI